MIENCCAIKLSFDKYNFFDKKLTRQKNERDKIPIDKIWDTLGTKRFVQ